MPLILTSDLGWIAGQDISALIAGAFADAAASAPRELRFTDKYRLAVSNVAIPDDLVISATDGSGLTVTDPTNGNASFSLGNRNVFRNLTVDTEGFVDFSVLSRTLNPANGTHFSNKLFLAGTSKADFLMERCDFDFNGRMIAQFENCDNFTFRRSRFRGAQWKLVFSACRDMTFDRVFFDAGPSECIKTTNSSSFPTLGCKRFAVTYCVFQENWRDGIDTTGGFQDSTVSDSIFRDGDHGVGGGMDFKQLYDPGQAAELDIRVRNVQVNRCTFVDCSKPFVFSVVDRSGDQSGVYSLTAANVANYAPHDITITDTVFGKSTTYGSETPELALVKGAHTIAINGVTRTGGVNVNISSRYEQAVGAAEIKAQGVLNYDMTLTGIGPVQAAEPLDLTVPFAYGSEPGGELATFSYPEPVRFSITEDGVLQTDTDLGALGATNVTVRAIGPGGESVATISVTIGA